MNTLRDILSEVKVLSLQGDDSVRVSGICIDSRLAQPGWLFAAIRGVHADGHEFIGKAVAQGASVIVCEQLPEQTDPQVVYVQVDNAAQSAGRIASAFYNHPSEAMEVVGITGTNGKTTTATLCYQLFTGLGYHCGLISTVQNMIGGEALASTHTTPDAVSIQQLMARMREAGCVYVFMEVSSHAVHQERIAGIRFRGAAFTNITHDHLDYHHTFDEYIRVKKKFFDDLPKDAFALSNADDKRGPVMLQNTAAERCMYSLRQPATFTAKVLENGLAGLVMQLDGEETHFRMIGTFNAYNLLAVYGIARLLGKEKAEVLQVLSMLRGAAGRFETCRSEKQGLLGIVDYAHTPDALLNVLATINQLRNDGQRLITIIGCGGDRDKTKRPLMAQAACEHSDQVLLTSDNPRTENPEAILDEMEEGLSISQKRRALRISDRRSAIRTACTLAGAGDIILVAGKGHETYQEVNGVKTHFDDREVLTETFKQLDK